MFVLGHDEVAFGFPYLLSKPKEGVVDGGIGVAGRTIPCRVRRMTAYDAMDGAWGEREDAGRSRRT